MPLSQKYASVAYTLAGPPLKIIPFGSFALISVKLTLKGKILHKLLVP